MKNEEFIEDDIVETELDLNKVYNLPKEIKIIKYKDIYLAIYTEGILWIVLNDDTERNIFEDIINNKDLQYLFDNYDENSVINVITQIEAKKFETPFIAENIEKNVYIYLTNNCNQRCKHCYMYAGDIKIAELSVNQWCTVLDKLKAAGIEGVTFTGGEITVYNGYEKIIKYAHDIGLLVTVLSNGIIWTEQKIDELYGYIDEIQISIDGYDSQSYYEVRQYDGFDRAITCIEEFAKRGNKVSMAVTPLFDNLDKFIDEFEPFAKKILEKYPTVFIKLNHELIKGREVETDENDNKEYKRKLKLLVERLYPDYYSETFVLNYENKSKRTNCGFGGISIAANGDIYWCNRIHELESMHNILNENFDDIMRIANKVREDTSVDNTVGCKTCEIRYICGGGCRMKYQDIKEVEKHVGEWSYKCEGKESLYEKMLLSNEYFFEE